MNKRLYSDYDGKSVPTVAQQNANPDDIPKDIWKVGVTMADEYVEWLEAGNSVGMLSEHAETAMADTISRAIMAEREACARYAEDFALRVMPKDYRAYVFDLATAIRNRGGHTAMREIGRP